MHCRLQLQNHVTVSSPPSHFILKLQLQLFGASSLRTPSASWQLNYPSPLIVSFCLQPGGCVPASLPPCSDSLPVSKIVYVQQVVPTTIA